MDANRHELVSRLIREFFQAEQSTLNHARIEAERLGHDIVPGRALLDVAEHGDNKLPELEALVRDRGLPARESGKAAGEAFSTLRRALGDTTLTRERSYRGTLLAMTHGVQLADYLCEIAKVDGDKELSDFFDRWLLERRPLVSRCEAQLRWFAEHTEEAAEAAKENVLAHGIQSLIFGLERLDDKVRNLFGGDKVEPAKQAS